MSIDNSNILKGYITRTEALNKLETKQDYIKTIVSGFNIKTKNFEGRVYYNLKDLEKALEDVDKFHKNHYSSKYVFDNIISSHIAKSLNLNQIKIPKHYGYIKNSLYKNKSLKYYYNKEDLEKALNSNKFSEYVDKKEAFNILETTQDYIKIIVSGFNIRTRQDGNKIYYNLKDLEKALESVDEFHKNHYSSKYVSDNLISKNVINAFKLKEVFIPKHYANIKNSFYQNKLLKTYYRKKDVDNTIEELRRFIDRESVLKVLEVDSERFILKKFVEDFNIKTIKIGVNILYNAEDVNRAVNQIRDFYSSYYTYSEVSKVLNIKDISGNSDIERVNIPKSYIGLLSKSFNIKNRSVLFSKEKIDELIKKNKEKNALVKLKKKEKSELLELQSNQYSLISTGEYISKSEALEKLSFSPTSTFLQKLNDNGYLDFIEYKGSSYYKVKDIDGILKKREDFFSNYVPVGKLSDNYFKKYGTLYRNHSKKIKQYEIPIYCKGIIELTKMRNNSGKALNISELIEYLEEYKSDKKIKEAQHIVGRNDFETFLLRLGEYSEWGSGFDKNCIYTKEKYLDYVKKSINGKTSKKSKDTKIRQLIELGISIKNLLDRNSVYEIFNISDSNINFFLNTLDTYSKKYNLYRFISEINSDFKAVGKTNKLKFKIEKISRPKLGASGETWDDSAKDLYSFETYSQVFSYVTNIDIHISKILDELNDSNSVLHASIWLYVILHLNNAWRNGDCNRFPELVIGDLLEEYEISSIEWFKCNNLTLPQAKQIVFRVRQWEMRMSKTQINGTFFCSDDLAPAFATVVIILHLYKYNHLKIFNELEDSKLIMSFDNHYNEVTSTMLKKFFQYSNLKNFKFSSRKFNKSVMTYIYFLANLNGDSKALIYSAKLRGHMNLNNTNHYIDFGIDKIESLSRQLFTRGEFGYIPALLAQKVLGKNEYGTFEDMTKQIIKINAVFGDVQKMNVTAKFLNIISSEKQNLVDMISEKSFTECQELLTDIFTCSLPSKDGDGIQCLFSKQGCQMQYEDDDFSCFDCPYHIPSIYALTKLCNNLIDNYKDYLGIPKDVKLEKFREYLLENLDTKPRLSKKYKMQIGLKIERRKRILKEALDKYGQEYIYRCLDMDRQTFIDLSNLVKLDFYETYPQLL